MRPTTIVTIIFAAAIAIDSKAESENWYRYDIGGGSMYVEVDLASITVAGAIRKARVRMGVATPIKPKSGETFDYATSQEEHNCETDEVRIVDAQFFLRGEQVKVARTSMDWRKAGSTNKMHRDICEAIVSK